MADTPNPFAKYAPTSGVGNPFAKFAPTNASPSKVYYNELDQPVDERGNVLTGGTRSGEYTGTILPLHRDKGGHVSLAVPEIIASPLRGVEAGGKRALGIGEEGKDPLRPLSPDITAAAMLGASPLGIGGAAEAIAPRTPVTEARQAGYVLPPAAISDKPGIVSNVLAGWSGKIKTQQAASARNQVVTNELAAQALGLPRNTVLTDQVFNNIRAEAGKAYEAVKTAIPVIDADESYIKAIADLGGANSQAAQIFPKITKNPGIADLREELQNVKQFPTEAGVEVVKELRFNANANLRAVGDPSKHALGLAQRQAADEIDALMERRIVESGQPDVVDTYRKARRLIAKSYDIEGATNPATGDVNARGLARLAMKGRPLTDELDTIATAAAAFPKAMQVPLQFGGDEKLSGLDFFGSALAIAHGAPDVAGLILARPLARHAILSEPFQNSLVKPRNPAEPSGVPMNLGVSSLFSSQDPAQSALGLRR